MSYLIFTSYARANVEHPQNAELLMRFLDDLRATVADIIQTDRRRLSFPEEPLNSMELSFRDSVNIETGSEWLKELEKALCESRVGLALYSKDYFLSEWCGREFQVFLNRAKLKPNTRAIVPVLWTTCNEYPEAANAIQLKEDAYPEVANAIQYKDDLFPPEYKEKGLKELMQYSVLKDAYRQCVNACARRIKKAVEQFSAPPLDELDIRSVKSAWNTIPEKGTKKSPTISKTCFVYVAQNGWNWTPYPETQETVGMIAQRLSSDLKVRYEEIPCDERLQQELLEQHRDKIPTLLIGDPDSMVNPPFAAPMQAYHTMFLLNCGTLLPWKQQTSPDDPLWKTIQEKILPQKTASPPPHHEWRSIFSAEEFKKKALDTLENIRMRLLGSMLAPESKAPVLKAENEDSTALAAAKGICLATAPQLGASVTPPQTDR